MSMNIVDELPEYSYEPNIKDQISDITVGVGLADFTIATGVRNANLALVNGVYDGDVHTWMPDVIIDGPVLPLEGTVTLNVGGSTLNRNGTVSIAAGDQTAGHTYAMFTRILLDRINSLRGMKLTANVDMSLYLNTMFTDAVQLATVLLRTPVLNLFGYNAAGTLQWRKSILPFLPVVVTYDELQLVGNSGFIDIFTSGWSDVTGLVPAVMTMQALPVHLAYSFDFKNREEDMMFKVATGALGFAGSELLMTLVGEYFNNLLDMVGGDRIRLMLRQIGLSIQSIIAAIAGGIFQAWRNDHFDIADVFDPEFMLRLITRIVQAALSGGITGIMQLVSPILLGIASQSLLNIPAELTTLSQSVLFAIFLSTHILTVNRKFYISV